jgi:TPR repeat protein
VLKADTQKDIFAYLDEMGMDGQIKKIIATTPYTRISEFVYDPDMLPDDQPIVQLGFHMPPSARFPTEGMPQAKTHKDKSAADVLSFAVEQGSMEALQVLVRLYESTAYGHIPEYAQAFKWLEYGLARQDISSIHSLAFHYQYGTGVEKNETYASVLYQQAANLGFAGSQNNLGWNYYKGTGVPANTHLAVYWLTRSAEQGEPFAYGSLCEMYGAGDVFPRDDQDAFKWCYLADQYMPLGHARDTAVAILGRLSDPMTDRQVDRAAKLAADWVPLKPTQSVLGNVED